jgi:uncharacterized protein (DUF1778 family)
MKPDTTSVIKQSPVQMIRLSIEDQRQIVNALLNPPKPTPALNRAFRRRRELFGVK